MNVEWKENDHWSFFSIATFIVIHLQDYMILRVQVPEMETAPPF